MLKSESVIVVFRQESVVSAVVKTGMIVNPVADVFALAESSPMVDQSLAAIPTLVFNVVLFSPRMTLVKRVIANLAH